MLILMIMHGQQTHSNDHKVLRMYPIEEMFKLIRESISDFPKAALFELRDRGFNSLFEQCCAFIVSVRTFDEVTLPASLRLFGKARKVRELYIMSEDEIYELIRPASFATQKAKTLKELARVTLEEFDGELPADYELLTTLPGLGPRGANTVLGIAAGVPALGVDIHVHRVTNRWGYLNTESAEQTLLALARKLPKKHWIEISEVLVPFGKHICQGSRPLCSICPVFQYCERRGVTRSY